MKILIFGGTTEGRLLAEALADKQHDVAVSVATELGAEELKGISGIKVLTGRLVVEAMAELMKDFELCVDATHPYAKEATANIRKAAGLSGISLKRLVRNHSDFTGAAVVENASAASEYLADKEGNILLATGIKDLHFFSGPARERLFVRTLPVVSSIEECEKQNIPHKNIIAMQGPFSLELNIALIKQFSIKYMVTKDGGSTGGFDEKREAAEKTGVELVVISRPEDEGETMEDILGGL